MEEELAHQVLQAHQEREAQRVTQGPRAIMVSQVRKSLQALRVPLVLLAHKVLLVLLVRGANEANEANKDPLALPGNKDREVPLVREVQLESVVLSVLLVPLDLLARRGPLASPFISPT